MPLDETMADRNVRPTRVFHRRSSGPAGFGKQSRRVLVRAVVGALAGLALAHSVSPALGALAYWDTNGTTPGAVNTAAAPANGTWGVNPFWNPLPDGTGTPVAWTNGDTAVFSAGGGISGGL